MTKELVNEVFYYNDGKIFFQKSSKKCGYIDKSTGYERVAYNKKIYYVHRLIYLLNKGYLPKYIDHIDGDKTNNKLENLRECTQQENCYNSKIRKNNKLGYKGITLHKWSGLYRATAKINNKCITIGYYKELEKAVNEYRNFIIENHKQFAKLN
jgi:hypothetical protein